MEKNKIAVVGCKNILFFKSGGADVFMPTKESIRSTFSKLLVSYKVILIEEEFSKLVDDLIQECLLNPYPVVLILKDKESDYTMDRLSQTILKSLGVNLSLKEEE